MCVISEIAARVKQQQGTFQGRERGIKREREEAGQANALKRFNFLCQKVR